MSQAQCWFKADLREIEFLLFEQHRLDELLSKAPFDAWGPDEVRMVLGECLRFATEVLGPLNQVGDRDGCRLEGGHVRTPEGFDRAWKLLYEQGWRVLSVPEDLGGQGAPQTLQAVCEELMSGANPAFMMYPGLTHGAAELIAHHGTPEQIDRFARPMFQGRLGGTMCLSEPQAGSDVGSALTKAKKVSDGVYSIQGTKCWISAGDHQLADNVAHLVLARIEGAEAGTKGLSLFIVPKYRLNDDGTPGQPNDVTVAGIEHKMGLNGSATCTLQFGDNNDCHGYLVGGVEHQGMRQMFTMMNYARIGVGLQGLAVAGGAYHNALDYAKQRKQGSSIENFKDPHAPRVPIIDHADVRRMLMDMKAKTEGIRALLLKLTMHQDRATALAGKDDDVAAYHKGQVELLTPLVKAYSSEQAYRVAELAIQVHGGAGYVRDFPVEQAARDSKVFSIYEGTTHIQALDLVSRKLGQAGGKHAQDFFGDVGKFAAGHMTHDRLFGAMAELAKANEAVTGSAFQLLSWFRGGQAARLPLNANRFLEMMSELAVGWMLLRGAVIAHDAQSKLTPDQPDHAFYEGKILAAIYFARNVLPDVVAKRAMMEAGDTSALDIPVGAFATV
ncbi:MAG: acyl-CoA dehydrogenase [Sandaracinaceae bacterium]